MNYFLIFLKIVVGVPFFALIALFLFIGCYAAFNSFSKGKDNTAKEQHKKDLQARKAAYKKTAKTIVIDDAKTFLEPPIYNDYSQDAPVLTPQEKRQKEKAVSKRRKRNRIAKKSRRQNRK
jgi:hypothetical protein